MKYYFIIGIILGIVLWIYSIKELKKIKGMIKTSAIVTGYHLYMGRSQSKVTRVQVNINGKELEKDLNYYSIFLRKGKKINVYYEPNNTNIIKCTYGDIFVLMLGVLFIVGSVYLMVAL